jgi:tetrapyrrole methylase family protein/MazG family protein
MPGRITVVGLGPGDPALRTVATQAVLASARLIILRTQIHPGLDDLIADPRVITCDDLYETLPTFAAIYSAIADRVLGEAATGDVVYAVPGHPRFGEESVRILSERAAGEGFAVNIHPAISAVDVVAATLGIDPMAEQVQILDAVQLDAAQQREPFAGGLLGIMSTRPCLVCQVYSSAVASAVKLALSRVFPDDHPVVLVRAAATPAEESVLRCSLGELDHHPVDHLTSVWVPPLAALSAFRSPLTLQHIVALLRAPGGCPWDREQTHGTLRDTVLEEAFEVADAIDAGEPESLAEELGDLLLHVAMHAQIAEESGDFTFEDVCDHINRKLIRRHPHVFATVSATTPHEVIQTWEGVKAEERQARGESPEPAAQHPIDRLPRAMSALLRAQKLIRKSAEKQAVAGANSDEELGDQLFDAVEALVRADLNPELELEKALRRRFAPVTHDRQSHEEKAFA